METDRETVKHKTAQRAQIISELKHFESGERKKAEIEKKTTEIEAQLYGVSIEIASQRSLQAGLAEFKSDSAEIEAIGAQINTLEAEGAEIDGRRSKLVSDRETLDLVATLLRDTGIKAQIISQYLPVINAVVNKYLADMEFFASFEIDSNFNETLRSRHYDEFSYANFSQGEKLRIDLALLLAWRHVAAMKNSVNTNILLFDEILDASLDTDGCEILLEILRKLSANTSIFVISHKGDVISEKFDRVIEARKTQGFTFLREHS